MVKYYFIKISYEDVNQPLRRIHRNGMVDLDLCGAGAYDLIEQVSKELYLKNERDLTIDFMIEVPEDV